MTRWTSVAALLERALVHETTVADLRQAQGDTARYSAADRTAADPAQDDMAERWAAEHWMPAQRRSEPGDSVVRPAGWHPVPHPRHSTDARPANPRVSGVAERLAG